jgi:hypothetical protein
VSVIDAAFQLSGMTISGGSIEIDSVNRTAGISGGGGNYYSDEIALEAGVLNPQPITPRNVRFSHMAYRR